MKIISFKVLKKPKREKKAKIFCVGKVFKPTFFVLLGLTVMFSLNLVINNFFYNMRESFQNFVESFVKIFY